MRDKKRRNFMETLIIILLIQGVYRGISGIAKEIKNN